MLFVSSSVRYTTVALLLLSKEYLSTLNLPNALHTTLRSQKHAATVYLGSRAVTSAALRLVGLAGAPGAQVAMVSLDMTAARVKSRTRELCARRQEKPRALSVRVLSSEYWFPNGL